MEAIAETAAISIHALREEGDLASFNEMHKTNLFLSTPSARRATDYRLVRLAKFDEFLSTPSARRATWAEMPASRRVGVFLSTPSARRATDNIGNDFMCSIFLSTPSARRATVS